MTRAEQLRQLAKEIKTNSQAISILNEKQRRMFTVINGIASELEEENPDGPENPSDS
ncbi:hypothetical protein ES703_66459 [subsurface metagenome]